MKHATLWMMAALLGASVAANAQVKRSLRAQHANDAEPAATAPAVKQAEPAEQGRPMAQATLGAPKVRLGTIESATSCREKVLRYPRLLPQELGYEVKSFSFSMQAGNANWGPVNVKGAVFTEDILDKIKDAEATKVKLSIDNIVLTMGGRELAADPVVVEYDH